MSARFVSVDRETPMLLPPDLRDWVPEDDLVHFVIEAVDRLPLEKFRVNHRCPGRIHAAHTRKVNNRLATALRMAAQSLYRSKSGLGDWFRRIKSKPGTKAAVTAAAHKLARILGAMVKHRRPYNLERLGNHPWWDAICRLGNRILKFDK